jgi:hypothetical protein
MLPALPAILGNGVGGTVPGTGPFSSRAGRRVVASLNGTGGYAERAVAPTARLIEVPDGAALRDAVGSRRSPANGPAGAFPAAVINSLHMAAYFAAAAAL